MLAPPSEIPKTKYYYAIEPKTLYRIAARPQLLFENFELPVLAGLGRRARCSSPAAAPGAIPSSREV